MWYLFSFENVYGEKQYAQICADNLAQAENSIPESFSTFEGGLTSKKPSWFCDTFNV